jgi:hypothetical protein
MTKFVRFTSITHNGEHVETLLPITAIVAVRQTPEDVEVHITGPGGDTEYYLRSATSFEDIAVQLGKGAPKRREERLGPMPMVITPELAAQLAADHLRMNHPEVAQVMDKVESDG